MCYIELCIEKDRSPGSFRRQVKLNQSAEGAGGLGIIRSNKVGETE